MINDDLFGIGEKQFMDPVHGGFRMYDHEILVIDQPLFQRLRFIKQNDVANLVYPGTTHTRFQHSLGVMHVAGRVYRSVIMNQLKWTSEGRHAPISFDAEESIRYFYFCFRLAALLHDTGHFPFSHEFENSRIASQILASPEVLAYLKDDSDEINEAASHENYSLRCARELINGVRTTHRFPVETNDVLTLMEKSKAKYSESFKIHAKRLIRVLMKDPDAYEELIENRGPEAIKTFLSDLISGELDVDKMDYLLRDSYYTGVRYGVYNVDHLISTLRIGVSIEPWWVGVAILDKGIGALEDFVFSRFQLYMNVWSHKGIVAGKLLLGKAVDEVLNDATLQSRVRAGLTNTDEFCLFTEDMLWEAFREMARRDSSSYSARLLRRELPIHLRTEDGLTDFKEEQVLATLRVSSLTACAYKTRIKFSKIRHSSFGEMKVLKRRKDIEGVKVVHKLDEIASVTDFFAKFEDTSRVLFFKL